MDNFYFRGILVGTVIVIVFWAIENIFESYSGWSMIVIVFWSYSVTISDSFMVYKIT